MDFSTKNILIPLKMKIKLQFSLLSELSITVEISLKTVDFLNVVFDSTNGTFKPYRKPNDNSVYIYKNSSHSPSMIKEWHKSITHF